MAYMNQEKKAAIKSALDKFMDKKDGWKYSLRVQHHSTLELTILQGPVDFIGNYRCENNPEREVKVKADGHVDVNEFWLDTQFSGEVLEVMRVIKGAMNVGNHDNSDPMTDYYDVGHYVHIGVGDYNKPYVYVGETQHA